MPKTTNKSKTRQNTSSQLRRTSAFNWKFAAFAALALIVAVGYLFVRFSRASGTTTTDPASKTSTSSTTTASQVNSRTAVPNLWDPDTFQAPNGKEYTYFSSQPSNRDVCGAALAGVRYKVPVIEHDTSGLGAKCITTDALPGGAGAWAIPDSEIWAPSIAYFSNKYFLYYAAQKTPGQWCIGLATSTSPLGPFTSQREFACPSGGRWAIDPDVLVDSKGVFVAYRDDAIAIGNQTGISSVQVDANGAAI